MTAVTVKIAQAAGLKGKQASGSKHPVGLDWVVDDAGHAKGLHVVLEDMSAVSYVLSLAATGWVASGQVQDGDRSAALSMAERATCAHTDSTNKLLAAGIQMGLRGSQGRVILFDTARPLMKATAPRSITLANVYQSSVLVEGDVTNVVVNSTGDLLMALCSKTLMLMHIGCSAPAPPANPMLRVPKATRTTAGLSKASQEAPPNPTWRQLWPEAEVSTTCYACSFSQHNPLWLLTLEKRRLQNETVESIRAIKYEYKAGQVRVLEHTTLKEVPDVITACEWNASSTQLVVGGQDGMLVLHDYVQGGLHCTTVPEGRAVQSLAWHPSGAIIAATLEGGCVCVFDCALQPLTLTMPDSRPGSLSPLLDAVPLLGLPHPSRAPAKVVWNLAPGFVGLEVAALVVPGSLPGPDGEYHDSPTAPDTGRSTASATAVVPVATADEWSTGLLQIPSGAVSSVSGLVQRYLADQEARRALEVASACGNSPAKYHAVSALLNQLLREHRAQRGGAELLGLLDSALSLLWPQVRAMEAGQAKVVAALFQRYCHQLLAAGQLEHAFRVAATLSSRAALDDVYVVAIQRSEANVAEAVYAAIAALPAGPGCPLPPRVADLLRLQRLEQEAAQGLRPNGKSPEASQEECVAAGIALEARGRIHEALALYSEHRMVEAQQQLSNLMQAAQVA